jgi:hypothetical protein
MTIQNNKIIAEFMGCTNFKMYNDSFTFDHPNKTKWEWSNRFKDNIETNNFSSSSSFYDNDWNWLMEVVEKIESLEFYPKNSTCIGFDSFGVEINKNRCDITRYGDFTSHLLQSNGNTRMETVYNAVLDFIKWYNEQSK